MKKMLKTVAVLATMVMALTLGACDNGSSSGSGGVSGNTPNDPNDHDTPKNPFGFTEEDNGYAFYLDKDGKVLQRYEGEDVEGAVFQVIWTLTDGTGEVRLEKYYGDYEDVTIPDGVTTIGGGAFEGCSSLVSVTIPGSVTTMRAARRLRA